MVALWTQAIVVFHKSIDTRLTEHSLTVFVRTQHRSSRQVFAEMATKVLQQRVVHILLPRLVCHDSIVRDQVELVLFVHVTESLLLLWVT